ncbi:MAG: 3'-5' exonuclease [Muribaculaceae bacterium]|jgi:DNA polymerase-3 subunit epsilon|nr:3'-5' exonuclease [Muribaculaceae bacterium]
MKLNLKKPIVFFDLETTGVDVTKDHIVEISIIKILPTGEEIEKTRRINPGIKIPPEATAVHHITDEDVADAPMFKQIARSLANELTGCDIAGFNSNKFDIPMLDQEFQRAGVKFDFSKSRMIDVQTIFHKKEQRTLVAAYRFYCGKELDGAHSANADTRATYEVLMAQLDKYDDLPNDMEELSKFSQQGRNVDFMSRLVYNDNNEEVINFGKYKGQLAADVLVKDPSYYDWIMKGDFSQNTKDCFTRIKLRMKK